MQRKFIRLLSVCLFISFTSLVHAALEYDQDVTPNVIFGTGNGNGFFTVERNSSAKVEVGLRAKIPFKSLYNSQGDGTYVFTLAETDYDDDPNTPNRWNVEFSINTDYLDLTSSGNNLDDFLYEVGIDQDPSEGVNFTTSDPIKGQLAAFAGHSMGNNSTPQSGGVEPSFLDYTSSLPNYNVIQNSIGYTYQGYDPAIDATYDIYLLIKSGATILAKAEIQVIIGAGGAPINSAPVITSTAITSIDEDSPYSYTLTATDANAGDALTYSAVGTLPSWLTFNTTTAELFGTPTNDDVGMHNITLRVNDGTVDVDQSFTIEVINTNDAPVITSSTITSVDEDQAYSYTFTATDVDVGDTLTYSAPTLPGWLTFDSNSGILSGTPTGAENGNHNVILRVNDGTVDVDQSFIITVQYVNDAPSFSLVSGCDIDTTDVTSSAAPSFTYPAYAFNMLVGPVDELSQTFMMSIAIATGGDTNSIINSVNINNNGDITFNMNTANSGVAVLDVAMTDSGGTINGGTDTQIQQLMVQNYGNLELDPNYSSLNTGDILYKNTFDPCR